MDTEGPENLLTMSLDICSIPRNLSVGTEVPVENLGSYGRMVKI